MKRLILIIGHKIQPDSIEFFVNNNEYDYLIVYDQSKKINSKYIEKSLAVDFSSEESLIKTLPKNLNPSGAITRYENFIVPKLWVSKFYDIPYSSMDSLLSSTDKELMRERFSSYDKSISPDYKEILSLEEAKQFVEKHQFPVMLKPAHLVKSLLISKNSSQKELEENFEVIKKQINPIYEKYGVDQRKPKILIEEFLEGTQHTVAAFVDKDGNIHASTHVIDIVTAREIGINDNFLYSRTLPSKLDFNKQNEILETAKKGIKALGLKSSPAHVELIYTKDGAKIIEIGPRIGGYRTRMFKDAANIDLDKVEVEIASGNKLTEDLNKEIINYTCVIELFPKQIGNFSHIKNIEELRALKSLKYISIKRKVGELTGLSKDGFKMTAIIILSHSDKNVFEADLNYINLNVRVVLIDEKNT